MQNQDKKLAVCGILLNPTNQVLTVSRKDDHKKIGLVGGKVDTGETLEQAIVRECFEETGVVVQVKQGKSFTDVIGEFEVTCFLLQRTNDDVYPTDPKETGLVRFLGVDVLLSDASPFMDYNVKAFKELGVL